MILYDAKTGAIVKSEESVMPEPITNEQVRVLRAEAYHAECDNLLATYHGYTLEAEEAETEFERDMLLEKAKQMKTLYLAKKQEIRERFPYHNHD